MPPSPINTPAQPSEALRAQLRVEEYRALRATIGERGTRRVALMAWTIGVWAALAALVWIWIPAPIWSLAPLLVLIAGFEGIFALHVGVERIGRYLQVEFEDGAGGPGWEHSAMRFGVERPASGGRVDPLFGVIFIAAVVLNLIPVALASAGLDGAKVEVTVYAIIHAAVIAHIARRRAFAAKQRELDLAVLARRG